MPPHGGRYSDRFSGVVMRNAEGSFSLYIVEPERIVWNGMDVFLDFDSFRAYCKKRTEYGTILHEEGEVWVCVKPVLCLRRRFGVRPNVRQSTHIPE